MGILDLQRVYTKSLKPSSNTMLIGLRKQHKVTLKHQKHYQSNTRMESHPKELIQLFYNRKKTAIQQQPKVICNAQPKTQNSYKNTHATHPKKSQICTVWHKGKLRMRLHIEDSQTTIFGSPP